MSTTFILVDSLTQDSGGAYAHYEHRFLNGNHWKFCDIRETTHRCQERWIAQINNWHQEICSVGSELDWQWGLLPASRIAYLAPIEFKPLFFTLGVIEYVRSNSLKELFLVGVPEEVKEYLQEWCEQSDIKSKRILIDRCVQSRTSLRYKIVPTIKPLLKACIQLCALTRKLFFRGSPSSGKQTKVLVFSLTLSANIIIERGDHFFGRAFDGSDSKNTTGNVQWFYYLTQFCDKDAIIEYCQSIGRNVGFEFQWLRKIDIIRIIRDVVRLRVRLRRFRYKAPQLFIDGLKLSVFSKRFVRTAVSGYVPIAELSIYWAMKNCLSRIRPSVVIYPFEQKGLERAILRACAEHTCSIQTIAFAHAMYNKLHWYICDYNAIKQPMPDLIAVTGPTALSWMVERTKWHDSRFLLLGSPRAPLIPELWRRSYIGPVRVLMIVGYSYEIEHLATWVEMQPNLFSECELMVRRYPYAWEISQNQGLQRLSDLGVQVLQEVGGLEEQIAWTDVVLFCSTSAGIEAMLRGRVVIRVNLDDVLNTDPTGGKSGAQVVPCCSGPAELKLILSQIAAEPSECYVIRSKEQRQFAEGIYMSVNSQEGFSLSDFVLERE